jgi:hypothetical protein
MFSARWRVQIFGYQMAADPGIDTNSLLKLLWQEPESERIRQRIAAEQKVVLSSLTELD